LGVGVGSIYSFNGGAYQPCSVAWISGWDFSGQIKKEGLKEFLKWVERIAAASYFDIKL
jgi:hypothetical protein